MIPIVFAKQNLMFAAPVVVRDSAMDPTMALLAALAMFLLRKRTMTCESGSGPEAEVQVVEARRTVVRPKARARPKHA